MKKLNNIWGFRSNKLWKKILASIYYIFCLVLIIFSLTQSSNLDINTYDMIIYKASSLIKCLAFLTPPLIFSFNIKEKLPFLKNIKLNNTLTFISIFITVLCFGSLVSLFHSSDYENKYEEFNRTKVTYQDETANKTPEQDSESIENNPQQNLNKNIKIHFIDVGQGDSIFIELPNSKTMLIDAGEVSKGKIVSTYISSLGYSNIDYLVGTHPHTDHIGGLAHIITTFNIGNIYMPKATSTSKTYENLLNTILQKNLKITTAKAGVNIINENDLKIDIIAPNKEYNDLNNLSAVVKIIYNNKKFLFMADAETTSENDITVDVSADVIKVGHHGSDSSSDENFVNKVRPKFAIIMVGANNQYNHPYQKIIDRWSQTGAKIYRTDINGNIIITSDGNEINLTSSK